MRNSASIGSVRREIDNRRAAAVIRTMLRGLTLHMSSERAGRRWWLSDGKKVSDAVAQMVIASPDVVGVGDSLFGTSLSQTFRHVSSEKLGEF